MVDKHLPEGWTEHTLVQDVDMCRPRQGLLGFWDRLTYLFNGTFDTWLIMPGVVKISFVFKGNKAEAKIARVQLEQIGNSKVL